MVYKKEVRTRYYFDCGGETWAITDFKKEPDSTWVCFEETLGNGHEDTHIWAEASLIDGKWKVDLGRQILNDYGPGCKVLEEFFNTNGLPTN